ncbi:MAG: ankyrin repeat domain-containing protein [Fimbriimonas sp.]
MRAIAAVIIAASCLMCVGAAIFLTVPVRGLKLRQPPLHEAAARGDIASVKALLDSGTPVDQENSNGRTALAEVLINHSQHRRDNTCLLTAELLIQRGANLNARDKTGRSIIAWLVAFKDEETAAWLVKKGALKDPEVDQIRRSRGDR